VTLDFIRSLHCQPLPSIQRRPIIRNVDQLTKVCIAVASVLAFAHAPATAAERKRNWQIGKVLDSQVTKTFAGSSSHTTTSPGIKPDGTYRADANTNTNTSANYDIDLIVTIQGDTRIYAASERSRWRWSKQANLTVNGRVQFAVEKDKLFVIDEDGKEHEMKVVKKVLMEKPNPETPK
jgi:hypothetical protein